LELTFEPSSLTEIAMNFSPAGTPKNDPPKNNLSKNMEGSPAERRAAGLQQLTSIRKPPV